MLEDAERLEHYRITDAERSGQLRRRPNNALIRHHLNVAVQAPARPRCPVCGRTGYRAVRKLGDDLVHVCRGGHPHYPTFQQKDPLE